MLFTAIIRHLNQSQRRALPTSNQSLCLPVFVSFPSSLLLLFRRTFVHHVDLPPLTSVIMTGAYNSFFRMFDRETGRGVTLEAWRESSKPRAVLRTRRVYNGGKRRRGDVGVDSLDFTKKILHMAWHPSENIIAIAATNNLYIFQDRVSPETQLQWQGPPTATQHLFIRMSSRRRVERADVTRRFSRGPSGFATCWHPLFVGKRLD